MPNVINISMREYCKLYVNSLPVLQSIIEIEVIIEWPDLVNVRDIFDKHIKCAREEHINPKLIKEGYAHHSGEIFYPFHFWKDGKKWKRSEGIYLGFSDEPMLRTGEIVNSSYYVDYAEIMTEGALKKEMFMDLI
jgi:hypothetical protein